MLPFFKKNNEGSVSSSIDPNTIELDTVEDHDPLESAMREHHEAQTRGDHKEAARIFRSAMDLVDLSNQEDN